MITGRLTADSELKYTNNSTAILKFSVAVGRYEKGQTTTSFFDVTQWGKAAESLAGKLTKGKQVVVRGEMRQEFWNAQDGSKRSKWTLVADSFGVQPLSYGDSDSSYSGKSGNSKSYGYVNSNANPEGFGDVDDDDLDSIPF
jgi:single-strand DNA-binding protein